MVVNEVTDPVGNMQNTELSRDGKDAADAMGNSDEDESDRDESWVWDVSNRPRLVFELRLTIFYREGVETDRGFAREW